MNQEMTNKKTYGVGANPRVRPDKTKTGQTQGSAPTN